MATPVYVVGNTHDFRLTATKDGAVWDITGATVSLLLVKPDGTVSTCAATLVTPASGIAKYVTLTTDLDTDGQWKRFWQVSQSGVVMTSGAIPFTVQAVRI